MVVAVAIRLFGGQPLPDYDATFALIWGEGLAHGVAPDYSAPFRPAGHPLVTLLATIGAPLGRDGAAELLRWAALLGAGSCTAAVFRAGQALFGTLAGAIAALLLATRTPVWGFSLLSYLDLLAAACVLYAVALEARQPRRGTPVFVLLALAGLLRPEVWLFALVYWLWCGRVARQAPLALLGPGVWMAFDLVTSQTVLGSLFAAPQGAPSLPSSGGTGIAAAPEAFARYVGGFTRPPEAVAAAVAIGFGLWMRNRRIWLPLALLALNAAAFFLVAFRNGPLEQRYLVFGSAAALVLAGWAIAGSRTDPRAAPDRRAPRAARPVAIVLALACAAYAPIDIDRLRDLHGQVETSTAAHSELRDLIGEAGAACIRASGLQLPDVRLRPSIAYWEDIPLDRIGTDPAPTQLSATTAVTRDLTSRSLPTGPGSAAGGWRLDGICARR